MSVLINPGQTELTIGDGLPETSSAKHDLTVFKRASYLPPSPSARLATSRLAYISRSLEMP
jgi:hypothetical protein